MTDPARTGHYGYQEFFDTFADHPRPWCVEDMLPTFVLVDRSIPQFPRTPGAYTLADLAAMRRVVDTERNRANARRRQPGYPFVHVVPNAVGFDAHIRKLLASIPLPAIDRDPPPWVRWHDHAEAEGCDPDCPSYHHTTTCGLPRPHANIGIGQRWLMLLWLIAAAAFASWIILAAVLT